MVKHFSSHSQVIKKYACITYHSRGTFIVQSQRAHNAIIISICSCLKYLFDEAYVTHIAQGELECFQDQVDKKEKDIFRMSLKRDPFSHQLQNNSHYAHVTWAWHIIKLNWCLLPRSWTSEPSHECFIDSEESIETRGAVVKSSIRLTLVTWDT